MKKTVSIFMVSMMICLIAGCSQKKANPVSLPEEKNIQSIDVTVGNETTNFSDSEWIKQCILDITNAQATTKQSVQDMPQVDEYIKIDINTEDAVSTLFVYIEKDNYYIEQPYQGIYKTDSAFYALLSGKNTHSSNAESTEDVSKAEELKITDLFPAPHGEQAELMKEADLDKDGKSERIILTRLPDSGGDGGYRLQIFKEVNGEEINLALPEPFEGESRFPFLIDWNGEDIKIYAGEECIKEISAGKLQELYQEKGMTDTLEKAKGKPERTRGDAISGFTVTEREKDALPALAVKTYLSGLGGHSDCIGYGIVELELKPDNTWNMKYYYMEDDG